MSNSERCGTGNKAKCQIYRAIDDVIENIVENLFRDYFESWFANLTNQKDSAEVRRYSHFKKDPFSVSFSAQKLSNHKMIDF